MRYLLIIVAVAVALPTPLHANVCAFDAAPAASLLFPFVVHDYGTTGTLGHAAPAGTTLTITNVSAQTQVVRVTVWSDIAAPVLAFNVLLTGYDVVTIDMREILQLGRLPVTVSEGHTDHEGVRDAGPVSSVNELNSDWIWGLMDDPQATAQLGDRCTPDDDGYPGNYAQPIPPAALEMLKLWLMASQTADMYVSDDCEAPYSGTYFFQSYADPWFHVRDASDPTWMYVTADVVERCDLGDPSQAGYWMPAGLGGSARYDNVLTGDVVWTAGQNTTAMPAVHLEADVDLAEVATGGALGWPVSFYARYSNLMDDISDFREPLPTAWAVRYTGVDSERSETRLLVWRGSTSFANPVDLEVVGDPLAPDELVASNCMPYTYYSWDEDANINYSPWGSTPRDCVSLPWNETICADYFPLAVQEVSVEQLETVDDAGWMLFVWPASNYLVPGGPGYTPDFYQTWMGVHRQDREVHDVFMPATVMGNYNCFPDQVIPQLGVSYDYVPSPAGTK
jgi:hypothetical protein